MEQIYKHIHLRYNSPMGRICEKCEKEFKTSIKIDGRWRFSNTRRFCYACSPFGAHNTRDLTHVKSDSDGKECCICMTTKPVTEFYAAKRSNGSIKTFSYCIQCELKRQSDKMRAFKVKCLEYKKTFACQICGYDKYIGALEFHHRDKSTKFDSIASLKRTKNWSVICAELDKCDVLCANCHREQHGREIGAG